MSVYVISTLTGILLRWCVSLYPYSGAGVDPMFGDYEAQRHWQEITTNLPMKEWYANSTDNDLLYWGLDYPPLTAYHSYICGIVAKIINPDFVALHKSRGYESYEHKLFMRYSVFIIDLLIYFPAVYCFAKSLVCQWRRNMCFLALVLYPGIFLIDYGHFQYNNASLGLFIGAVSAICNGHNVIGSIVFCLALNYKQMELYHALPFFFYLLGLCFKESSYFKMFSKLVSIAVAVLFTFILVWLPYLNDIDASLQVVKRIFPFNRGLFEDKVASIWCSLSVFIKFKSILNHSNMALICLLSTLICVLPSSIHLFVFPTNRNFRYSLLCSALVFFLFSFHVHEKSILLATIPACMVIDNELFMVIWFMIISNLSMLPLLIKDGIILPTISLTVFIYIMYIFIQRLFNEKKSSSKSFQVQYWLKIRSLIFNISMLGAVLLTIGSLIIVPPAHLPDLFPVLISIYSCVHFCLFLLYFHYRQFTVSDPYYIIKKEQ